MTQSIDTQKQIAAIHEQVAKDAAEAQAKSDACMKDDLLARSKGNSPAQIDARKRVALLFCEIHLPKDTPVERENRLALIDYSLPIAPANGRSIDPAKPKPAGFMGMGRKPAHLTSAAFPPKTPEDPIYLLEYIPVKR